MILKLDTIDNNKISVELLEHYRKIDHMVETRKTGSQILLPQIAKILKKNKQSLRSSSFDKPWTAGLKKYFKELTAIEVNTGPGSFTGTRVGVAVANALAFALNIPVNNKKGKIVAPIYQQSKFD